jgi:hypothetical protein
MVPPSKLPVDLPDDGVCHPTFFSLVPLGLPPLLGCPRCFLLEHSPGGGCLLFRKLLGFFSSPLRHPVCFGDSAVLVGRPPQFHCRSLPFEPHQFLVDSVRCPSSPLRPITDTLPMFCPRLPRVLQASPLRSAPAGRPRMPVPRP